MMLKIKFNCSINAITVVFQGIQIMQKIVSLPSWVSKISNETTVQLAPLIDFRPTVITLASNSDTVLTREPLHSELYQTNDYCLEQLHIINKAEHEMKTALGVVLMNYKILQQRTEILRNWQEFTRKALDRDLNQMNVYQNSLETHKVLNEIVSVSQGIQSQSQLELKSRIITIIVNYVTDAPYYKLDRSWGSTNTSCNEEFEWIKTLSYDRKVETQLTLYCSKKSFTCKFTCEYTGGDLGTSTFPQSGIIEEMIRYTTCKDSRAEKYGNLIPYVCYECSYSDCMGFHNENDYDDDYYGGCEHYYTLYKNKQWKIVWIDDEYVLEKTCICSSNHHTNRKQTLMRDKITSCKINNLVCD